MSDDRLAELRARKAAHLRGMIERRGFDATGIEVRSAADGDIVIAGHAATFNQWYDVGDPARGGFRERILPRSFRRTLAESPDVVLTALHGRGLSGLPLARTKNGSLRLTEDDRGLWYEADLQADDPDAQTLVPKLRRGDLDGASFAFRVTSDEWNQDRTERTIKGVTLDKGDISIVDFGSNPNATAQLVARDAVSAPCDTKQAGRRRYRERLAALGARPRAHTRAALAADSMVVDALRDYSQKDREEMAKSGAALPDGSFPIQTATDLQNAIRAYGRAKDKTKAKAHIIARARALGLTKMLPESWRPQVDVTGRSALTVAADIRREIGLQQIGLLPRTGSDRDLRERLLRAERLLGVRY